jgi:hypothetical protein
LVSVELLSAAVVLEVCDELAEEGGELLAEEEAVGVVLDVGEEGRTRKATEASMIRTTKITAIEIHFPRLVRFGRFVGGDSSGGGGGVEVG